MVVILHTVVHAVIVYIVPGNSALHDAAEGDNAEICEMLLDAGAEIVKDDSGMCPLMHSALLGNESVSFFSITSIFQPKLLLHLVLFFNNIRFETSKSCPKSVTPRSKLLHMESISLFFQTVPILLERSTSNIVRRDALKLLGCTRCDKKLDMTAALETWREAISIPLTEDEEKVCCCCCH